MKIGYARCSTVDQNLDWQIDALKKRMYQEKIYGSFLSKDESDRADSNFRLWEMNALPQPEIITVEYGTQRKRTRCCRSAEKTLSLFPSGNKEPAS